jgi:hypothetical protein
MAPQRSGVSSQPRRSRQRLAAYARARPRPSRWSLPRIPSLTSNLIIDAQGLGVLGMLIVDMSYERAIVRLGPAQRTLN